MRERSPPGKRELALARLRRVRYVLSGPYGTDTRIDSGYRTCNLELPCG
ncbi:hypothetical protein ACIG5E_37875 [Kitasatospora sp. NPDC053057]